MSTYDAWKAGDIGDGPYDEAAEDREEAVADRTAELLSEYATNDAKVLEAVEGVNTLGFDGLLDRAVRDFLMAYNRAPNNPEALAEVAYGLFDRLWPTVESQLAADARMDAEHERGRWEAEQAEMRNGGLEGAA